MSKVQLSDGNMDIAAARTTETERDPWESVLFLKVAGYTIEFDAETQALTISGGVLTDVECIHNDLKVLDIPECQTIVLKPSEDY